MDTFNQSVTSMMGERSGGKIISRHIVSANVSTNINNGSKTTDITIGHEIKTTEGYTLITNRFYQSPEDAECCRLIHVNVQNFDSSPAYSTIQMIEKVTRIMAYILPIALLILIAILLRARRKRKLEKGS